MCAAPAHAQLGGVLDPPVVAPAAPGAESTALGADAAHRNAWAGTGLRPPLELAWKTDSPLTSAPVTAGGHVVLPTASAVTAYDATSGAVQWNVALQGGPAEVATDAGHVFVATAGATTALDLATGAVQWSVTSGGVGPVAAGGRVLVGAANGTVTALSETDGHTLWTAPTGIANARPAASGDRVYATGACRAQAVNATNGLPIWTAGACATDTGTQTLLAAGFVLSEGAGIYQASDGTILSPGPAPGTVGDGDIFFSPLAAHPDRLAAGDAGTFQARWTWVPPLPATMALRASVIDGTVWQVVDAGDEGLVLGAINAVNGAGLWSGFLPKSAAGAKLAPGPALSVATGGGLLLVPTAGGGVAALRNATAGALRVKATLPANVVASGTNTVVSGTLRSDGHGLVGPRQITLEGDQFPFGGGYAPVATTVSHRAGFAITATVERNTRFRVVADGVTYAPTAVYAPPNLTVAYTKTRRKRVVHAKLTVAAAAGLDRAHGRVAVYRLKRHGRTLQRLGRGRSHADGVARFKVRIPAGLKRTDKVLTCLRGASRQGFGFANALDRHCGDKRIRVPAASQSSLGRSLRTATGSAMPLKRLWPASENR